jgi:AcrR family transcriptional regulator
MLAMASRRPRLSGPQRRARILAAAARAFAAHGYHAASIREIARLAGVTKPVLYDHFASKEHLYVALIESVRDTLTSTTAARMASRLPVEARVRAAVDAFFGYVEANPAAAKVLFTPPEGDPAVVEAASRVQQEATARLAALFGAEADLLPGEAAERALRLDLFTEFLKRGLHGLAIWWSAHPEVPRATLVEAVMQIAWAGLGAQFQRGGGESRDEPREI